MRFRFFAPVDEQETAEHLEVMRRIDEFWADVSSRLRPPAAARSVAPGERSSIQRELTAQLASRVSGGLVAELDWLDGRARLVVAPESDSALDPLVAQVIARSPSIPGVAIERYRPASPASEVFREIRELTGVNLEGARARAGFSRGHLLEVVVYSPSFSSARDEQALDAVNVAIPRLIGEEVFDHWVDALDVSPMQRPSPLRVLGSEDEPPGFALGEIDDAVGVAIRGVYAQLSEQPYHTHCERAEWTMLELEPEPQAEYPCLDDLALCTSMLPEMVKHALGGARFSSRRFSKNGERFVYLKVDGEGKDPERLFDQRLALEDALNRALVPGRVGCVVGAGLGVKYIYLILALADVDNGLAIARRVVQKLEAPKRSWFQFFDSSWAREWVGVYDVGPRPPGL